MILCVDADDAARASTRDALEVAGLETTGVASLAAARDHLAAEPVECVVTAHDLPDGDGLEVIRAVRDVAPDAACVLYTDRDLDEVDTEAVGEAIAEYVPRDAPDAADRLVDIVEHSLSFRTQTAYPLPEHEDARLAALERYATDPQALSTALDRLTELATDHFDVASAAVGLIDAHEERFLSCHGAAFDTIPREETVCTYTILDDEVTVIEDTDTDPRFADIAGLAAAGIRFYAGAPVATEAGFRIGVFCLHDDEPRSFDEHERALLRLYAAETMDQLELRRRLGDAGTEGRDD